MSWTYSEQNIVQEPAAKMMEAVGWTSVLAYDAETFGPNGMLGRADKSERDGGAWWVNWLTGANQAVDRR